MARKQVSSSKAKTSKLRLFVFTGKEGEEMGRTSRNETIPKIVSTRKIRYESISKITPLTDNQRRVFEEWGNNLVLHGMAGSGKTFLAIYLALRDILSRETSYTKLVIVRSIVPVRDIGFLPGSEEEKIAVYEQPYTAIFRELMPNIDDVMLKLKEQDLYQFIPTSFIRGITLKNSIIVVDEAQDCNFHELDSVITRLGDNCKVVFCGDKSQTDLVKRDDINGISKFMSILRKMSEFRHIEFSEDDIVRSAVVKEYIINKHRMGF